jgi:HAD superfamily hydrolase (TIGR01459 family)
MNTDSKLNGSEIPVLRSAASLAQGYDVWLCDIWGVLHNGVVPFASAVEACRQFRQAGGVVILISNAPRPFGAVATQIAGFGVAADCYDGIVTSGDVTRALLGDRGEDRGPFRRVFHLGPERDLPIFEGLQARLVEPEHAEIVVCSGLYDDETETPDDYAALFDHLLQRNLKMICANPDVLVGRGEQLVYCAGALAVAYEKLGGDVVYAGKPHRPIYDLALAMAAEKRGAAISERRVLAIGDGLATDLHGAAQRGLDALFVAGGMHKNDIGAELNSVGVANFFAASEDRRRARPLAAIHELSW